MMKMLTMTLLAGLVASCGSLDDEPKDTACAPTSNKNDVSISAPTVPGFVTGSPSVKVRGEASHSLGLAIRRVTVAGLDATSDAFNFAAWSIDVPGDLVVSSLAANATLPATIKLTVTAYDVCNRGAAAGTTDAMVTVHAP